MILEFHFNPVRHTSGEIVGETFWMPSAPPKTHEFSTSLVDSWVARGAMAFAGSPVTLELEPDPNGPLAGANGMSMTYKGDKLLLTAAVGEDTEPTTFTYKITHFPIPQNFRHKDKRQKANDASEREGIRIAPAYGVELVEA